MAIFAGAEPVGEDVVVLTLAIPPLCKGTVMPPLIKTALMVNKER